MAPAKSSKTGRMRKNASKNVVLKTAKAKTLGLLAKKRAKQKQKEREKEKLKLKETKTRIGKKTSEVWNFFQQLPPVKGENPTSLCNICGVIFKCPGGSTTGMRGHLERKHPGMLSVSPTINPAELVTTETTEGMEDEEDLELHSDENRSLVGDNNSFSQALMNSSPIKSAKVESQCEETIRNMAIFCIMDLKPLSTVDGDGFRGMLSHFDQNYILATMNNPESVKTVAQCVDDLYQVEYRGVVKDLEDKFVCLTVETWSKNNVEKFVTTTAHCVNENWKLESRFLTVRMLPEPLSTKQTAKEAFISTVLEGTRLFGIKFHNLHSIVVFSDLYNHIETEGDIIILPCLNQVVKQCFINLKKTTAEIFEQDVFSNCLEVAYKYLPDYETLSRNPYNLLIALISSRKCIESKEKKSVPWNYLPALATLLSPLNDVIEISLDETSISGCISISTVFPLMFALKDQLEALQDEIENFSNEKPFVSTFIDVVMNTFGEAYGINLQSNDFSEYIICLSAFLDPRYKALKFINDSQRQSIYDATIEMLKRCHSGGDVPVATSDKKNSLKRSESSSNNQVGGMNGSNPNGSLNHEHHLEDSTENNVPHPQRFSSRLSGFLMRVLGKKIESESSTESEAELQHYLSHQIPAISTDPLAWWHSNSLKYPTLSVIAMKFLGVAANSSRAEHVFSKLGPQYDRVRSALEPEYIEKLLFLNKTFSATVAIAPLDSDSHDTPMPVMAMVKCEDGSEQEAEVEDNETNYD